MAQQIDKVDAYDIGKQANHDATKEILEGMIDANHLGYILGVLSEICEDKAAHVRENWQDVHLARQWQSDANKLHTLSNKVKN